MKGGRPNWPTRNPAKSPSFRPICRSSWATPIDKLIAEAIAATGASSVKDMGKVMGVLKPKLQGRADMGQVGGKIKTKLGAA
jgi:hypothetical protein